MPTRFPGGLSTSAKKETLSDFILPSAPKAHVFFDDFNVYNENDWNIVEVGTGTRATVDEDGGVLEITNGAIDNNENLVDTQQDCFTMVAGDKLWFECRFKVDDATQSEVLVGLALNTAAFTPTDGVYFKKVDGSLNLNFFSERDSVSQNAFAIAMEDDTYVTVGWYFDGGDNVNFYVNGEFAGKVSSVRIPDDVTLSPTMRVVNGEAVAKTLSVDYIFTAKQR